MTQFLRKLTWLAGQKDLALVVVLAVILMMLILPLPTLAMDLLIAVNMSISIVIVLVAINLHSPVQFSTFPAVILISTLFRLSISIATTRLILLEGHAGEIVETFGQVVVGGNLVVGLVIFLIITIVQFLVITKGADRVAEVSARFTLDGLPGKQMSIDADLRAGLIDQLDARTRRQALEEETRLFGAMDGAMKFVKGESVAGIVITAVNLIGGIAIGMFGRGLSFAEAGSLYSLMTIGDGLVAQIPALLVSIASGTIVTRVTNQDSSDLGTDIGVQIAANSRTIIVAGFVVMIFGLIPGFPTLIFVAVGTALSGGCYLSLRRRSQAGGGWRTDWRDFAAHHEKLCRDAFARTGRPPSLRLVLPEAVTSFAPTDFAERFETTRQTIETQFGIPMGYWRFEFGPAGARNYRIHVQKQDLASGDFDIDTLFVRANASYLAALGIDCLQHYGEEEGAIVSAQHDGSLEALGVVVENALTRMFRHVETVVLDHLADFVGMQQTTHLLKEVEKTDAVLVEDLRNNLSVSQVSAILKRLAEEQMPLVNIIPILETILAHGSKDPNPRQLVEKVRAVIGETTMRRLAPSRFLPVLIVAPSLETTLRDGERAAQNETFLVVDPAITDSIVQQVRRLAGQPFRVEQDPVLITQPDVRRFLHNLLIERGVRLPVVSYQEIPAYVTVYPVGFIQAEPA